ncbi:hypothetical protein [Polaromonas sp. CF318]|uniref:hypothetical protein n=1 Tax=Polaromonas sp. CF318 TaxID=1144318 RepID=UPI0012FAB3F5|nr:hypothetical protein [Polaromonas sp. CF318]
MSRIAQQSLAASLLLVIACAGAQQAPVQTDEAIVRSALPVKDLTEEQSRTAARIYCARHVPDCRTVTEGIRIHYAWMFTPLVGDSPKPEKGSALFGNKSIQINAATGGIGREDGPSYESLEALLAGKP